MCEVDPDRRTVTVGGVAHRPPRMLFELIRYLSHRPGYVRTREEIMDAIRMGDVSYRAVDSAVKRIRRMGIEEIQVSHGVGYYWREPSSNP